VGAGAWLDSDRIYGVDVGFLWLAGQTAPFSASSQGSPILARPFFDTILGSENSLLFAFPGVASPGSITASASSHEFYGIHADLSENIYKTPNFRLDALGGYRYLHLSEQLNIQHSFFPAAGGAFVPGTEILAVDQFGTLNEFQGGEIGFKGQWFSDRWSLDVITKVAVGNLHRNVLIDGNSVVTAPGAAPAPSVGGLLALPPNIGSHPSNETVVAPEAGLNLGWNLTSSLRLRFGYSVLVLTGVARPGDQVNLNINPNFVAPPTTGGPNLPSFQLQTINLWVQTLNMGLEFRY
jgi:hypothetical protein